MFCLFPVLFLLPSLLACRSDDEPDYMGYDCFGASSSVGLVFVKPDWKSTRFSGTRTKIHIFPHHPRQEAVLLLLG